MVYRYVQYKAHGLTIIQVILYGQRVVVVVDLGYKGFCDRRNHA
jgi:hypothetical protein